MRNVEIYRESELSVDDVLAVGADHVAVATGARWSAELSNGATSEPLAKAGSTAQILTPDDVMDGRLPQGPTLIFDDDNYYMGSVLAEHLRGAGPDVTLVTPADKVSAWSDNTDERWRVQRRLLDLEVGIVTAHALHDVADGEAVLSCVYTGRERPVAAQSVVLVTRRKPNDGLYRDLQRSMEAGAEGAPRSLSRIGDCEAPAIIAAAVYAGHRYARELDTDVNSDNPLKYDRVFSE